LPGKNPLLQYSVKHLLHETTFTSVVDGLEFETAVFADSQVDAIRYMITIKNASALPREIAITGFVDWLMGQDTSDAVRARAWSRDGALFATGVMDAAAYFACDADSPETCQPRAQFLGHGGIARPDALLERKPGNGGHALRARLQLMPGDTRIVTFTLGCEADADAAYAIARKIAKDPRRAIDSRNDARIDWQNRQAQFAINTGDAALDSIANGFLVKQVLDGRLRARTGLYQSSGAYGFRDQLQDVIALLPFDPERARAHILTCAQRQFQSGDVMHWWHAPMLGVRTRITDDMLFLPYAVTAYVRATGERDILNLQMPFLEDIRIPDDAEDIYAQMRQSTESGSLHEHCMRAFAAQRTGEHGLALMGSGDWNDGMNRVGCDGKGESVWLTMFAAVCARSYAEILYDGDAKRELLARAAEYEAAIEAQAWDGKWYIRAFTDAGEKLGAAQNSECEIDLIAQAWAALAGLDPQRVKIALQSAGEKLFDREHKLIKLLAPPFMGESCDPGYIAAYPAGVRENGGQYTHAACWYLLALAKIGDASAAHDTLSALLPMSHARTRAEQAKYRIEPYVVAADVYAGAHAGRGGWTWYTGAAGWLLQAIWALLGYERVGNKVRLNALAGMWARPSITIAFGSARYTLISDGDADGTSIDGASIDGDWIEMRDDGELHEVLFPMRSGAAVQVERELLQV
jgi:cellobiose phosphorylase